MEHTDERKKCFRRYFDDVDVRRQVNLKFTIFSSEREDFHDVDSLRDKGELDAKSWWPLSYLGNHTYLLVVKGIGAPTISYIV